MMKYKYVVTLWQNFYDYDGLTSEFFLKGSFSNFTDAKKHVKKEGETEALKQINENEKWGIMVFGRKKQRMFNEDINIRNKVVYSLRIKTGDGSGYNSIYNYYEVIRAPHDTVIEKGLFVPCWEVQRYFDNM